MPKNPWNVVIAGVAILMCLGVAYAWGVFLIPIDQYLGWERAKISFAISVLLLVFSAFMAIGGLSEKKFGPQKTASIGGMLVGLGWILSASANSPFELYLFYGGLAGIGTGLSYMPAISSDIKCFPKKRADQRNNYFWFWIRYSFSLTAYDLLHKRVWLTADDDLWRIDFWNDHNYCRSVFKDSLR